MPKPILTIIGPTAVGKTGLALAIAERIDGEIVGLDSRQMYAGMEVGTAQPSAAEQAQVPHHLVGVRLPDQAVSAGEYAHLVKGVIEDIHQRQRVPIICGGAGLYYRALSRGIFPDSVSDLDSREYLNGEYDQPGGAERLLERLREIDPDYAEIVHPNNRKRLVRALEIFQATGKPPTEHFRDQESQQQKNPNHRPLDLFSVFITRDKSDLEEKIRQRTEAMLAAGWVGEVERLRQHQQQNGKNLPPLDSIGYREISDHLQGKLTYTELVEEINLRTRQYAKRQLQWFRKESVDLSFNLTNESDDIVVDRIVDTWQNLDEETG